MVTLIIMLLLIGCWLFIASTIYLAARCIRESGALAPFLPAQYNKSEKKDPKLLRVGTETEGDVEHV